MAPLNSAIQNLLRNIFIQFGQFLKISIFVGYMQILVNGHAQACPDPPGAHLLFQNLCNNLLVTEPKHYYLVQGGFRAI